MARLNRAHRWKWWNDRSLWILWILFRSRWGASKKERPGRPGFWKKKRKSPTPWILSNLGTLSTCLEIVIFNLDTLDSFCWMSGRIPVDIKSQAGSPSENVCCNWGNEKAQAKEAAKVWARQKNPCAKEHQAPIQPKRIIKFCDHMMSHDVVWCRLSWFSPGCCRGCTTRRGVEGRGDWESSSGSGTKIHVVSPWLKTVSSSQWKVRNSSEHQHLEFKPPLSVRSCIAWSHLVLLSLLILDLQVRLVSFIQKGFFSSTETLIVDFLNGSARPDGRVLFPKRRNMLKYDTMSFFLTSDICLQTRTRS